MPEQYFTSDEAGKLLGVSGRTFRRWAREPGLRIQPRLQGRRPVYSQSQIARVAKAHGITLDGAQPAKVEQRQQMKARERQSSAPAPVEHRGAPLCLALSLVSLLLWFGTLLQCWQAKRQQH